MSFEKELEGLINRHSQENLSNTPDFILAQYLSGCLAAFNAAVGQREDWYGRGRPHDQPHLLRPHPPAGSMTPPTCSSCGAEIIWARTHIGRAMPVDATPVEGGNIDLREGVATIVVPGPRGTLRHVSPLRDLPGRQAAQGEGVTLVLSLFPGADLLGHAFTLEGFTVVTGPDVIWGGDIRSFHPPAGRFDGIIGGPPCQLYGGLANFAWRWHRQPEHLIPEFERLVGEARPEWFLMENVPRAPLPEVPGYIVKDIVLNNRWLGEKQDRTRRFSFGTADGAALHVQQAALEPFDYERTLTSAHAGGRPRMRGLMKKYSVAEALELQGCPPDLFDHSPFTSRAQIKMLAQGVPLPMGRAVARAVRQAIENL